MEIAEEQTTYSGWIAFIYTFNLIVGAGALALPEAFGNTGWALGIIVISVLALVSYCTSTFMIEAMSIANGMMRLEHKEYHDSIAQEKRADSISPPPMQQNVDFLPTDQTPLLINSLEAKNRDLYDITKKVEMGQMARLFFNKGGLIAYYVVIALYLYGDLAIYAAAVPKSLVTATCGENSTKPQIVHEECRSGISNLNMYRLYLLAFVCLLCPFTFFNLGKTKFLQHL